LLFDTDEAFPEHFERREEVVDLDDDEKKGLVHIGDSITERLVLQYEAMVPGKPECGIQSKPLPLNFVPGSKFDFSVVATLLAQKFGWHIPTHRSQDIFAGLGWPRVARASMIYLAKLMRFFCRC
jgi:hypothetical protein